MDNLHLLTIDNRKRLTASGVLEVKEFSDREVKLKLSDKTILILYGNNFKIGGFDEKSGNVLMTGDIISLKYKGREESLLKKVFK